MDITLKPRKNKHLNAKECCLIEALLKVKFKESEIANPLGRHVSTIYRLESLLKRKLILKLFLVVILKKYKTGLIIILENYLIINRLKIFFMRT